VQIIFRVLAKKCLHVVLVLLDGLKSFQDGLLQATLQTLFKTLVTTRSYKACKKLNVCDYDYDYDYIFMIMIISVHQA